MTRRSQEGISLKLEATTTANDQLFDLAAAKHFREANPPSPDCNGMTQDADLSSYVWANPDALEFLSKQGYNSFAFIGLEQLDKRAAVALAGWDTFLCFHRLVQLDVEVAKILVAGGNQLAFDNLHELGTEVVRELAKLDSMLCLELDSLSIDIAELARHSHELELHLHLPLSDQVMHVLCNHAGYRLHVQWARSLGEQPCAFLSPSPRKNVFVIPQLIEETGQWFENVYINDVYFNLIRLYQQAGLLRLYAPAYAHI